MATGSPAKKGKFSEKYLSDLHNHAQPAVDRMTTFLLKELGDAVTPTTTLLEMIDKFCEKANVPYDVKAMMHGMRQNANYLRHSDAAKPYEKELPYHTMELFRYEQYGQQKLSSYHIIDAFDSTGSYDVILGGQDVVLSRVLTLL